MDDYVVTELPDGVLIRATGPLPEPDTSTLQAALTHAGLSDNDISIDLVPSRTVQLSPTVNRTNGVSRAPAGEVRTIR